MTVIKPSDSFTGAQNIDVVLFIVVFLLLGKEYILQPILLLRIRCKPCIGFLAAISLVISICRLMATDSHLYRVRSKLLIETFSLLDKTYELKRALGYL